MKDEEENILIDGADIHYSHVPSFGGGFIELTNGAINTGYTSTVDTSINNISTSSGSGSYYRSFPFDLNSSDAEIITEIQRLEKKVLKLKAMLKGSETRNEDKITRRKLK